MTALVLIVIGVLLGPALRGQIVRYAVPDDTPLRVACDRCTRPFGLFMPVSGRCPGCETRVGAPAWAVELVVGVALVVLALRLDRQPLLPLLAVCWLVLIGAVLAFVDLAVHRLPNRLTGAAAAGVLVLLGAAAIDQDRLGRLGWAVVCGLGAAAGYLVLAFIYPAGLGMGDVKLAIGLGMLLGWWGGAVTLLGIAAGFFVNGVLGAVLLATGRVRRGDQLPHGPAMLLGALGIIAALGG